MKETIDLTGSWVGIFNYPANCQPATNFAVRLRDSTGTLSGDTSEPDILGEVDGQSLHAFLTGSHVGGQVEFLKCYENYDTDPIIYSGTLADGGNEIAGDWTIPDVWSGTFIMIRQSGKGQDVEREVELDINV